MLFIIAYIVQANPRVTAEINLFYRQESAKLFSYYWTSGCGFLYTQKNTVPFAGQEEAEDALEK